MLSASPCTLFVYSGMFDKILSYLKKSHQDYILFLVIRVCRSCLYGLFFMQIRIREKKNYIVTFFTYFVLL